MTSTNTIPVCSYSGCAAAAVLVWLRFADTSNTDAQNVFSCAEHQINVNIACLTHLSTCTAPDVNVPNCNCTPVNTAVAL